jgi:hypothetical protein
MDTMIERDLHRASRPEPGVRRNRAERDRALELRAHIRNLSIGLAAAGTLVFAAAAATTLPGHAATGGSPVASATGSGTFSGGLQPPSQLPSLGQGGGVVTGGS